MSGGKGYDKTTLITAIYGADTTSQAQFKVFSSIISFNPHNNPMQWRLLSSPLIDGETEAYGGCGPFLVLL